MQKKNMNIMHQSTKYNYTLLVQATHDYYMKA